MTRAMSPELTGLVLNFSSRILTIVFPTVSVIRSFVKFCMSRWKQMRTIERFSFEGGTFILYDTRYMFDVSAVTPMMPTFLHLQGHVGNCKTPHRLPKMAPLLRGIDSSRAARQAPKAQPKAQHPKEQPPKAREIRRLPRLRVKGLPSQAKAPPSRKDWI